MDKIDQLTALLERLNAGENPVAVKQEAQEFLASIDPSELAQAEQKLIDAGLAPEDLRHLCSAHMEMMGEQVDAMMAKLKPGHVIHTMVCEHERILGFLDKLEGVNKSLQQMEGYDAEREEFATLVHIAQHLVDAEPHHEREEEVLFPEVERRGMFGPPQIMRMEHEQLRPRKKELLRLAQEVEQMDFAEFKKQLDATAKSLILTLRDHIFKENNILYPTAVQIIPEPEMWDRMKDDCDKIGYCCFTPSESGGEQHAHN